MENSQQPKPHIVVLPHFLTSHIIPVVDTARLFAARGGFTVTIITTPSNAHLFQDSIDRDIAAFKSQITVRKLKFPASDVGLPEGLENFSALTGFEIGTKLIPGIELLRKPMEQLIRDLRPNCILSDMFYPWTVDLAKELNIPRLVRSTNCFYPSVVHSLKLHAPFRDSDSFVVPGLPDKFSMKSSEVEDHVKTTTAYGDIIETVEESYKHSYGVIFTSYSELEPAYVNHYRQVMGTKCWHIGLASHFINNVLSPKKKPLNNNSQQSSLLMKWLDGQKPESVVYVAFGSMIRFLDSQLHEIALALEESGCNFIWVVRNKEVKAGEEAWLPQGYEERLQRSNKGLIVREWVPQTAILAHEATGAFMTHCGWNSSLEGITAGVPLIAWPLFAEQFYNEKLITQVLKIGVAVGNETHNTTFFEIKTPTVGKDKIAKAISYLMGGSDEVQEMRLRVKKLSSATKRSQEEGGLSSASLDSLIKDIENYKKTDGV